MGDFSNVLRETEQQIKDEVASVLADAATRAQRIVDEHLPHDAEAAGEKLKTLADELLGKVEQLRSPAPASTAHDGTATSTPGQATDAGV
jgi:hypothetical protein